MNVQDTARGAGSKCCTEQHQLSEANSVLRSLTRAEGGPAGLVKGLPCKAEDLVQSPEIAHKKAKCIFVSPGLETDKWLSGAQGSAGPSYLVSLKTKQFLARPDVSTADLESPGLSL